MRRCGSEFMLDTTQTFAGWRLRIARRSKSEQFRRRFEE
jgi:hypothetical protein